MIKRTPAKIKMPKNFVASALGWWQDRGDDVGIRFHFAATCDNSHLIVRAFNSHDGEEMIVRCLKMKRDWITFETLCISTQFSAGHRWRFLSKLRAEHELTLPEIWVKASRIKYDHLLSSDE